MPGLASDLANPDFVGPTNPDAKLAVRFYSRPLQNNFRTLQEGRPIFEDRDFVRIEIGGDRNNIIDTLASQEHKDRFPLQWARYQNNKNDTQEVGTPLSAWPIISASQAEELRALSFRTVESIAGASDAQIQRIGMVAGMSPLAFRDRAQQFLRVASDSAAYAKEHEAAQQQAAENAALKQQVSELQGQVGELLSEMRRRKGGRPKKRDST